jgi:hypothetical protein
VLLLFHNKPSEGVLPSHGEFVVKFDPLSLIHSLSASESKPDGGDPCRLLMWAARTLVLGRTDMSEFIPVLLLSSHPVEIRSS